MWAPDRALYLEYEKQGCVANKREQSKQQWGVLCVRPGQLNSPETISVF